MFRRLSPTLLLLTAGEAGEDGELLQSRPVEHGLQLGPQEALSGPQRHKHLPRQAAGVTGKPSTPAVLGLQGICC